MCILQEGFKREVDPKDRTIGSRLYDIRKALGLTQKEFSKILGIKQGTLCVKERGDRELLDRDIKFIELAFPNVNMEYLLKGNGEPLNKQADFPMTAICSLLADISDMKQRLGEFENMIRNNFPNLVKSEECDVR